MNTKQYIFSETTYHKWTLIKPIGSTAFFEDFLNWVSGEFDLLLQEDANGLQVYFPNGSFNIKKVIHIDNSTNLEINVYSKVIRIGESYFNKISSLHQHFTNLYRASSF